MSINKNFKYKIYWKQIILIAGLIISISVTMLYAATTNKNIELKYDADTNLSEDSPKIILTSKNGKQLILQKLNQGDAVFLNTDETNGRICFKASDTNKYVCFATDEYNISMLEWQGLQDKDGSFFSTQPAIGIESSTGKMQYRDQSDEGKWHSFGGISDIAISYSLANKDQKLSENHKIFMNNNSLTFDGTANTIIIDSTGNINVNGKTTLNDVTLNGSLKIGNNDNSHYITIETPANINENYTITLPKDIGNSGQVLVTDGNEKIFWESAVNDTNLAKNDQTLDEARTIDINGNSLTFHGEKDIIINENGNINIDGDTTIKGSLEVTEDVTFNDNLDIHGNVTIDGSTELGNEFSDTVRINGSLRILNNTGNHHVTIKSPNIASSYIITIPENNGISDQILMIDANGELVWELGLDDTSLGKDEQTLEQDRLITMNGKTLTFAGKKNVIIGANGSLDLYGNAKIDQALQVEGATSLENKLTVEKETLLNNNLNVSGNTIIGSGVEVAEAVDLDSILNVNDDLIINGSTTLGDNNDTTVINGSLKIVNDNNFIIIKASDSAKNNTLILPENDGDFGQVLSTDGTGKTFWGFDNKDTNLSNTDQTLQSMRTVIMNEKDLIFKGTNDVVIDSQGNITINGITTIGDMLEVLGDTNLESTLNVEDNLTINGSSIILGNDDNDMTIVNGSLKIANGSNHYITIKASDSSANYTLSLPVNEGEQSQILSNDGNGITKWTSGMNDTNLGNTDQSLQGMRKIVMDSNNLIFNGTKKVIISADGNIDISGNANIGENLEVEGTALLNNTLTVNGPTFLNNDLHVLGDTSIGEIFEILGTANFENTLSVSNNVTIDGTATLGNDNNSITIINGELKLRNSSGGNYITIQSPDNITKNYSFIMPEDSGNADEVLVSEGNGVTNWMHGIIDTNLGSEDQELDGFGLRMVNMNGNTLTFAGVNTKDVIIDERGNIDVGQNMTIEGGLTVRGKTSLNNELTVNEIALLDNNLNVSGNTSIKGDLEVLGPAELKNILTVDHNVTINGSTNLGNDNSDVTLINNSLKLNNSNNNYIIIKSPDSISIDYIFVLPEENGDNGSILVTDGNKNTSWEIPEDDTSISDTNQTLEQSRTVNINGNNLTFDGIKDTIIDADGNIDIGGNVTLNNGDFEVGGITNLKNKLVVDKAVTLKDILNVSDDTSLKGTFEVTKPVTLQNTLNVDGDVITNGLTTLGDDNNDTIIIKGPLKFGNNNNYITMESPVFISSNYTFVLPENAGNKDDILALNADKKTFWSSTILNDINLGNADQILDDTRLVDLDENTLTFQGTKDIVIDNGNIDIGGNTTLGGQLEVIKATNLKDALIVDQAALFKTTFNVKADTNLANTLQVSEISTLQNTLDVKGDLTITGSTTLGNDNTDITTINNTLKLADNGSDDYITIQLPDTVSSHTFFLPKDDGDYGDALITDGNGATSWKPIMIDTSLSNKDQTLDKLRKVIMNQHKLTFNGTRDVVIDTDGNININGDAKIEDTFEVTGATLLNNQLKVDGNTLLNNTLKTLGNTSIGGILKVTGAANLNNTLAVTGDVTIDGSSTLGQNNHSTKIKGSLKILDNNKYITIKSPSSISDYTFILPEKAGIPSQALSSNGDETTTWLSTISNTNLGNAHQTLSENRIVDMAGNNLTFNGAGDVVIYDSGNINIDGNTTIGSNLEVTGTTNLENTLTVIPVSYFKDKLDVTGNTIIEGILDVTGSATLESVLNVGNDLNINGSTILGDDSTDVTSVQGSLKIANHDASNHITIKSPFSISDYTFTLPKDGGNSGDTLVTDGNGLTSWGTGGSDINLGNNDQSLTENRTVNMVGNNLTFNGTGNIIVYDNGNINISGSGTIGDSFEVTGTTILQDTLIVAKETLLNNTLNTLGDTGIGGTLQVAGVVTLDNTLDVTGDVTINGSTTLGDSNSDITSLKGSLKIADDSATNHITIGASTITEYTLILPENAGQDGDVLITDGNGLTSWGTGASDNNLGNTDQSLTENRTVNMMGNNLIFNGTGNVFIYDNGNMDVDGKGTIGGTFEVAGTSNLKDELIVYQPALFQTTLNVKADTNITNTLKVAGISTLENTLDVNGDVTINGSTTLGDSNSDITKIKGSLKIADDSGNNYIIIKSPVSLADNYLFVLPVDDGEPNQILATDDNGVTSWVSAITDTNLGNANQTLNEERKVIIGENDLIFQGVENIIYNNGNIDIGRNGIIKGDFQAKGPTDLNELTVDNAASFKTTLSVTGATVLENDLQVTGTSTFQNTLDVNGNVTINGSTTLGDSNSDITSINGSLKLADSDNSNYITIKSPDSISTDYTFILPENDGELDQILTSNGIGGTIWKNLPPDKNLGNSNQSLMANRTVDMAGNNLIFQGTAGNIIIYDNGNINISGSGTIGDGFEVTGATILQDALTVQGAATLNNNLNVTKDTSIGGTLQVEGVVTIDNTLDVTGNAIINGSTILGDNNNDITTINGTFKLADNDGNPNHITISPSSSTTDYTLTIPEFSGESIVRVLTSNGNGEFFWDSTGVLDTNLGDTDQALTENRVVTMNGNSLTFLGSQSIIADSGNITMNGDVTVDGELNVSGTPTFENTLEIAKLVELNNTLNVKGNTTVNGTLVRPNPDFDPDFPGSREYLDNCVIQGKTTIHNNLNIYDTVNISGDTVLGTDYNDIITIKGVLQLLDDNTGSPHAIKIKAPSDIPENYTFVLPEKKGIFSQRLMSHNDGTTSWENVPFDSSLGRKNQVLTDNRIINMAGHKLTFTGTNDIVIFDNGNIDIAEKVTIGSGLEVVGTTKFNNNLTVLNSATFKNDLAVKGKLHIIDGDVEIENGGIFHKALDNDKGIFMGEANQGIRFYSKNNEKNIQIKISNMENSQNHSFVFPKKVPPSGGGMLLTQHNGELTWKIPYYETIGFFAYHKNNCTSDAPIFIKIFEHASSPDPDMLYGFCAQATESASAETWFDANNACVIKQMRLPRPFEWVKLCESGLAPENDQWASDLPIGYLAEIGNSDPRAPNKNQGMGSLIARAGSCTDFFKDLIYTADNKVLPKARYRCIK